MPQWNSPHARVSTRRQPRLQLAVTGLGLAFCMLLGCKSAPAPIGPEPAVEAPQAFRSSGTERAPTRWWTAFGDPRLDAHVERALAANRDLQSIRHAFQEARAVARRIGAARRPTFGLFADASADRGSGVVDDETIGIGGAVAYEVDLWGRLEAQYRAGDFEAWASLSDYLTAALTLSAETARTWFRLLEAERQVEVLDEQIASNRKILSLMEPRVAAQQLRSVDLLRQETLVEATRGERIDAEAEASLLRNQLAVLTGSPPGVIAANTSLRLPPPPALPETGVPIETVRTRPDVRAARYRVMSSDQEFGAALRDRYPRLTIGASAGTATGIFEEFIATFAAGLLAPIADGGLRAAEIDRTRARRNRLRAEYAQSVLVAFREVEDALVEEDRQRRRLENVVRQFELTEASSARLRNEYLNGQGSYIDVLAALANEQQLRRQVLTTRRLLLEARIGLYRSLSGDPFSSKEGS